MTTHIPHAPTIWAHANGAVWKNASMPFADVTSCASNMPNISGGCVDGRPNGRGAHDMATGEHGLAC